MYNLPYFKEQDPQVIRTFLQQHPFAMLIGCNDKQPVATQVPLLVEGEYDHLVLRGHFMRNTDHHKAFIQNSQALCVFTGPHAYVSASWYTQPQTASTWNYMSVQARGTLTFTDENELREILEITTTQFEDNPASPASYHQLGEDYVSRLIKAIIGFRIEVTALENVFKLSQNRDEMSYENIIQQLQTKEEGAQMIAAEMLSRKQQLFK